LARQVVEAYGGSFEVLSRPANELLSRWRCRKRAGSARTN